MGLFVIVLDADSPVLVADGRCLRVAEVEFFCRIDQEDDREFKPLAPVDRHDADSIGGRDRRRLGAEITSVLRQARKLSEERVEAAPGAAVPRKSQLIEGKDMCFPEFAAGKSGDVSEVIGIRDDLPDERCCAVLDSLQAPFLVEGKEGRNKAGLSRFEDMIRISKDRPDMLSTGSLLGKSQARKILFIKAYEDRAQDSRQRQVLPADCR